MNEFNAFASGNALKFYETSMELRGMTLKAFGLFMGIEEIAAQANALQETMAFFTLSRDNNVAEIHAVSASRKEVAA